MDLASGMLSDLVLQLTNIGGSPWWLVLGHVPQIPDKAELRKNKQSNMDQLWSPQVPRDSYGSWMLWLGPARVPVAWLTHVA